MIELIAHVRAQDPLLQGLYLAAGGLAGVFVVMGVFFVSIIALEKIFRTRKKENQSSGTPLDSATR